MGSHQTSTILTVWDSIRDGPTAGAPAMSSTWAQPSWWPYSLSPGHSSYDLPAARRDLLKWTIPRSWVSWRNVSSIHTRPRRPTYVRAATKRSHRDSGTWSSSPWTHPTCVATGTGGAGPNADADAAYCQHGSGPQLEHRRGVRTPASPSPWLAYQHDHAGSKAWLGGRHHGPRPRCGR